eukprot:CAMPEP_0174896470 /NCGR_PEP_ID=MMETSP0167-20121228/10645_1 /TAXON_ID=38298 /ORGANISM="Rhodella maculata, Strain CCMP736" /LENGTH=228 /DNA_ID=CAMNT_0016136039 /DNA_START=237 /DNA_END=920 /DNA_ORIENTATION=-
MPPQVELLPALPHVVLIQPLVLAARRVERALLQPLELQRKPRPNLLQPRRVRGLPKHIPVHAKEHKVALVVERHGLPAHRVLRRRRREQRSQHASDAAAERGGEAREEDLGDLEGAGGVVRDAGVGLEGGEAVEGGGAGGEVDVGEGGEFFVVFFDDEDRGEAAVGCVGGDGGDGVFAALVVDGVRDDHEEVADEVEGGFAGAFPGGDEHFRVGVARGDARELVVGDG